LPCAIAPITTTTGSSFGTRSFILTSFVELNDVPGGKMELVVNSCDQHHQHYHSYHHHHYTITTIIITITTIIITITAIIITITTIITITRPSLLPSPGHHYHHAIIITITTIIITIITMPLSPYHHHHQYYHYHHAIIITITIITTIIITITTIGITILVKHTIFLTTSWHVLCHRILDNLQQLLWTIRRMNTELM
jgi:hypothetical protein